MCAYDDYIFTLTGKFNDDVAGSPMGKPYPHSKFLRLRAVAKLGEPVYQVLGGLRFLLRGALPPSHISRQFAQVAESGTGKSPAVISAESRSRGRRKGTGQCLLRYLFEFGAGGSCWNVRHCTRRIHHIVSNFLIGMEITGGQQNRHKNGKHY